MSDKQMNEKEWKKQLKKISKLPPPMIERKSGCNHTDLKKFIRDETIYQCQNPECGMIVNVVGASLYPPALFARNMMIMLKMLWETNEEAKAVAMEIMNTPFEKEDDGTTNQTPENQ